MIRSSHLNHLSLVIFAVAPLRKTIFVSPCTVLINTRFQSDMLGSLLITNILIYRNPCAAIRDNNGKVSITRCDCPQQADGRCSHVAALLYLVEDLSLGFNPKLSISCTSTEQKWGHGAEHAKTPQSIQNADYDKSVFRGSAYVKFDPRPVDQRCTTQDEINDFLADLELMSTESMWLDILNRKFSDYELDQDRRSVLETLSGHLWKTLSDQLDSAAEDPFTNTSAVHFGQTVDQASSEEWHKLRALRITASIFYDFVKRPVTTTRKMLWECKTDLSRVLAVQWGVANEAKAIQAFENDHGTVKKVGLFVSKAIPFLGASPDGFWTPSAAADATSAAADAPGAAADAPGMSDCVIEVKCPFIMQYLHPLEIEKLQTSQKRAFCCTKVNGNLKLKTSHKYYYQVQTQLFVTGSKLAKFII
jgi:hypothetical protein